MGRAKEKWEKQGLLCVDLKPWCTLMDHSSPVPIRQKKLQKCEITRIVYQMAEEPRRGGSPRKAEFKVPLGEPTKKLRREQQDNRGRGSTPWSTQNRGDQAKNNEQRGGRRGRRSTGRRRGASGGGGDPLSERLERARTA